MIFLKKYWKTLFFFAVVGLVGGFCTGLYLLDSYPDSIRQALVEELNGAGLEQIPLHIVMGIVTALQGATYGVICGALGIPLAKKVGLWRDERSIAKEPLTVAVFVGIIGGLLMILLDILYFNKHSQAVMDSYAVKPNLLYIFGCLTYGGVIEEVMLRLFFMSLVAFILHKLFGKGAPEASAATLTVANLLSALLFAAGHLPATFMLLGNTPTLIVRCFLLNGGLGILFGWLYQKYGLRYAMIAHGGCHIVSKLIWVFFL